MINKIFLTINFISIGNYHLKKPFLLSDQGRIYMDVGPGLDTILVPIH